MEPGRPTSAWDPLETELADFWEAILGRRPVSSDDDFFTLGGDSLRAVRLLARLGERWAGGLPPAELYAQTDLAGMAAALRRARPVRKPSLLTKLTGWVRRPPGSANSHPAGSRPTRRTT